LHARCSQEQIFSSWQARALSGCAPIMRRGGLVNACSLEQMTHHLRRERA
jgi:hypothetical protein